jgi:serine/threonine-protein kinase RsbW
LRELLDVTREAARTGPMRAQLADGLREVRRLNESVASFLRDRHVPVDRLHDVQLVVEELVTNIARHGGVESRRAKIAVEVGLEHGAVRVRVEDDGRDFDPTSAPEPLLGTTLEDRPAGGMGLMIVRRMVTGMTCRRLAGRNRTEAFVPLAGPPSH